MTCQKSDCLIVAGKRQKQVADKATGVDGVTKEVYERYAEQLIGRLVGRMKQFSYKPQPVRRTYIPKANGKMRPLGIPAYEDRLVQSVMADVLNDIYEERFCDCSYGFRPGRSAHDAVRFINETVMTKKINWILEADIKGFFDNVDHDWMMRFLEHDIADKNFLRYVRRFLKAGYMEDNERHDTDRGTPQGGQISPVLANVYLHYVLDTWYMILIRRACRGEVYYVRYADDFLLMFQYENEAKAVMSMLRERLEKFGLQVAEDKTRILPFGRFAKRKDEFDFLGFTFYNAKSRNERFRLGIRTSKKKLKVKRQEIKSWLRSRLTMPVDETMRLLNTKLRGHCQYYGVNGNLNALLGFYQYVYWRCLWMLRRRSQRGRRKLEQEKFAKIWLQYIARPKVMVSIWT
ncbi:MAG: group II intron reverse transcriptase/maturase [Lachnospiraceae bacterium]|nr:group II intron reverse transcriptase/maturase [Lachnospiraceae bacterium]